MSLNDKLLQSATAPFVNSENFAAVIYTGDGSNSRTITCGFQPDWLVFKRRDGTDNWRQLDSTRGFGFVNYWNLTDGQDGSASPVYITASATGFSFTSNGYDNFNAAGNTYVVYCWRANNGTTSSNSDGSITSTLQTNTDAKFSIIKYTGNGSAGATIGHNLGVVPDMLIVKKLGSGSSNWRVYHKGIDSTSPQNYNVALNQNAARYDRTEWNDTAPTSSVFSVNDHESVNESSTEYICYAFADTAGFSRFGSYIGTGAAGNFVETGFECAFLMIRRTDSTGGWLIFDNKRNTTNPRNSRLEANNTGAEQTGSTSKFVNFFSNGFEPQVSDSETNASGGNYIYMAFATDPDTEAPTLASSFNIKTYTGTGGNRSITDLGFGPGFVWLKNRSQSAYAPRIFDIVRGATKRLQSSSSSTESTDSTSLTSFDADGFSLGSDNYVNNSGDDFVAWALKSDDNEPTLFGGPAIAVYKFEDNANDVTGDYNGTASNVSYVSGLFNKAADFNGTNAGISFSSNMYDNNASHSVSFWLNPDTYASDEMIYWGGDSNIRWNSDGTILYKRYSLSAGNRSVNSTTVLSAGTWYHIVSTYSTDAGMALYINGDLEGVHTGTQNADSTSGDYGIMYRVDNNSYHSDGQIDQLRIYKGVISALGATQLYEETVSDNDSLTLGAPKQVLVSANSNAAFSIIKYDGTGDAGTKIPHGLSASPDMIFAKRLNSSQNWLVYHTGIGATKYLELNDTRAQDTASTVWNNTAPSATNVTLGTSSLGNGSGDNYIMYCFHDVSGYQKFGTYTGNGSASGPYVALGFEPDFVMLKRTDSTSNWAIVDSVRGGSYSDSKKVLFANLGNAESESGDIGKSIEFNAVGHGSNSTGGFQLKNSANPFNVSSGTYIYWALKINLSPVVDTGKMAYLVVAGGASGSSNGGGGGAGGLRTSFGTSSGGGSSAESVHTLSSGTYTITIGAGGAAQTTYQDRGLAGSASSISGNLSVSTVGGGGGGSNNTPDGIAGGSGGGAGTTPSGGGNTGGAGTSNEGFAGGNTTANGHPYVGAGGGGASAAAANVSSTPGVGGTGLAVNINNDSQAYAGGGGGA